MKTSAGKRMQFMPNQGESVSAWANRFLSTFGVMPNDLYFGAPGMPWVPVLIASSVDGIEQTPKLHRALSFLNEQYQQDGDGPTDSPYIWGGKLTFWFSDSDEAVLFKLALPNI